jgi:hypothetical protein
MTASRLAAGTPREHRVRNVWDMSIGYMIYQAERPQSPREQRAADAQRGELARGLSRLLHLRRGQAAAARAPLVPALSVPGCACALAGAREHEHAPAA